MSTHTHTHGVFTVLYTRGHLCPSSTIWVAVNTLLDLVIVSRLAALQEEGYNLTSQHVNPSAEEESVAEPCVVSHLQQTQSIKVSLLLIQSAGS